MGEKPKLYRIHGEATPKATPKRSNRCEAAKLQPGDSEKFRVLEEGIAYDLMNERKLATVEIRGKKVTAFEHVEGEIDDEKYFSYIASLVDNPSDVLKVVNPPIVEYLKDTDERDLLHPAEASLRKGAADCDNISWLAKSFFDVMGCRQGHDYEAKVIAMGEHAVCVYKDRDGQRYSLDQGMIHGPLASIVGASGLFTDEMRREKGARKIALNPNKNAKWIWSVDSDNLRPNNKNLAVYVYRDLEGDYFDPQAYAPEGWKNNEQVIFRFNNGISLVYNEGRLFGKLKENGEEIFYHPGTILIERKQYKEGPVVLEIFSRGRQLEQRTYRDGRVFFYYPDGRTVRQITYKEKTPQRKYEIVIFDQSGRETHVKPWHGELVPVKNSGA